MNIGSISQHQGLSMLTTPNAFRPLEPGHAERKRLGQEIFSRALAFIDGMDERPITPVEAAPPGFITEMLAPPPEQPGDLSLLLDRIDKAVTHAFEPSSPGFMAYVPPGGLFVSALADFYGRITNRFVGMALISPALTALEDSVVRWLAEICGLPEGSGGVLLTGGSLANFSAIAAARHAKLGEAFQDGTLYITAQTHHSIAKAARLAGLPARALRIVAHDADLAMDPQALIRAIAEDRQKGARPFLIVANAGTTNTGAIDPLPALAAIAEAHGLWLHVDAAYGGMFQLTERGRQRLRGIERAASITLDPHKGMFLPMGTGALIVREPGFLASAHETGGAYLHDMGSNQLFDGEYLPNFAELGPELTREMRGLRPGCRCISMGSRRFATSSTKNSISRPMPMSGSPLSPLWTCPGGRSSARSPSACAPRVKRQISSERPKRRRRNCSSASTPASGFYCRAPSSMDVS